MFLSCQTSIRVVSKFAKEATNGKTYFHLGVVSPDGNIGDISCTSDVFNSVIENKSYIAHFNINTAYLRKDFNCSIYIDAIQEYEGSVDKSIKKGA